MIRFYTVLNTPIVGVQPFSVVERHDFLDVLGSIANPVGAVISGVSNILSGHEANETNKEIAAGNVQMQRETNAQNAQLQREVNAQNYRMMQEQNAFNLDMWNKNNQYNSPQAQVNRLLQAGVNPAYFFGQGGQSSPVSSVGVTPAESSQMVSPHNDFRMPPYDFSFVGQATNAFQQSQLMNAQRHNVDANTANVQQQTMENYKSMYHRINFLREQAKKTGVEGQMARTMLTFEQAVQGQRISSVFNDVRLQEQQFKQNKLNLELGELQKALYNIQVAYAPNLNEAQLRQYYQVGEQIKAQIGLYAAQGKFLNEQRLHEAEKRLGTIIDNGLKGLSFQVQNETKHAAIGLLNSQFSQNLSREILLDNEVRDYNKNWWNRTIGGYLNGTSATNAALLKLLLN